MSYKGLSHDVRAFRILVQRKGQRNLDADREDHSFGNEIDQNTTRRERENPTTIAVVLLTGGSVFIPRLCLESFQFICHFLFAIR